MARGRRQFESGEEAIFDCELPAVWLVPSQSFFWVTSASTFAGADSAQRDVHDRAFAHREEHPIVRNQDKRATHAFAFKSRPTAQRRNGQL